jgi:hypothetical protein
MDSQWNHAEIGQELGYAGVGSVIAKAGEYCAYEERRIALTNEPQILALQAEIALCEEEARHLEERLRQAPPPGDLRTRRRKGRYYWAVTITLAVAAFVFSLVAFDPYRLGWKSYLYSLGIAIVTPFLIEEVIERWNIARLVKCLATVACVSAILSLVFLAVVRGDLLVEQAENAQSSVVIDNAAPAQPPAETTFYVRTLLLLRLAMVLVAIAMELGAGLALHAAWRMTSETGDDSHLLKNELRRVRGQMVALLHEMKALQNEPGIFVARFWRNFYRAMLTHTVRSATTKLLLLMVIALSFLTVRAAGEERTTIIAALDLTQSVAGAGPDKQTNFQKNVEGVARLLTQVPASSRVVVLGITDKSFTEPFILLAARVQDDPGYFGERLTAARSELVREWRRRSKSLTPRFPHTDIMGVLSLAKQVCDESPKSSRKVLVIFSDMRHHTPDVDLESDRSVPSVAPAGKQWKIDPPAMLPGVEVYVLGVDGAGKSVAYWQSLQKFWTEYFHHAGAALQRYSVLREVPPIGK